MITFWLQIYVNVFIQANILIPLFLLLINSVTLILWGDAYFSAASSLGLRSFLASITT